MDIFAKVTEEEKLRGYIVVYYDVDEEDRKHPWKHEMDRILFSENIEILSREVVLKMLKDSGYDETNVRKIYFPNSIKMIEDDCFRNFSMLISVKLDRDNSNLQYIGKNAFKGCDGVRVFYFPNSIRYIGESAFVGNKLDEMTALNAYVKTDFIAKDAFGIRELTESRLTEKE